MPDSNLLEALLDSWDRNNTILVELLHALPEGGMTARAMENSPSVAETICHLHYLRMVLVEEDAPEWAGPVPTVEWLDERDVPRLVAWLNESALTVRKATQARVAAGRDMDLHFDHPILLLQHLLWHESYHYGQMKLTLKLTGRPIEDAQAGPISWDILMDKKTAP